MTNANPATPFSVWTAVLPITAVLLLSGWVSGQESAARSDGPVLKAPAIPEDVTGTLRSLNEALSKDVVPADNAVVDLVQLFGVEAFDRSLRTDSLSLLGIERVSKSGPEFLYLSPYVIAQGAIVPEGRDRQLGELGEQLLAACQRPWTRAEFPELLDYLTANRRALDAVVVAAGEPRYYAPMLSEEEPPRLMAAAFVIERRLQFLTQCLCARGLLQAEDESLPAALENVLACRRWAVLLAVGSPFDVSAAKADVNDAIAFQAARAVLESGRLTGEQAALWLREWERVPRLPSPNRAADIGERAILHQELEFLKSDEESVRGFFEVEGAADDPELKEVRLTDLPWEPALQRADEIQTGFVRALATRDRGEQDRQFDELDRDYLQWNATADAQYRKFPQLFKEDRAAASRWIGEAMAMSLRPWYRQRRMAEDRTRVRRDLITVGLALAAFRHERGEYPAALSELAPKYLPAVPLDAHSDDQFVYVRLAKDKTRLTSWGTNRTNDAGSGYNDDQSVELR